jgi:hypothetical protein
VDFLIKFITQILAWLLGFVTWCVVQVVSLVLAGLSAIFNAIPVPAWIASASGAIANLPPGVAYLISSLELTTGAGIMISAYTIRFVIRRLPVVG